MKVHKSAENLNRRFSKFEALESSCGDARRA